MSDFICVCVRFDFTKFFTFCIFLSYALFICVNIYWESVYTNRLFCPRLEAVTYSSEKSQETLKNLNKALKKHLERDSLLEEIRVFNQDLSICCKIGTVLVLKLNIDIIAIWDGPMQDRNVTIINIFELFKQTVLINADKICAGSDDCREWEWPHLIILWIIKNKHLKGKISRK